MTKNGPRSDHLNSVNSDETNTNAGHVAARTSIRTQKQMHPSVTLLQFIRKVLIIKASSSGVAQASENKVHSLSTLWRCRLI